PRRTRKTQNPLSPLNPRKHALCDAARSAACGFRGFCGLCDFCSLCDFCVRLSMFDICFTRRAVACLGVSLLLLPGRIAAQATGAITGLVTDASGGVLPGVSIEVTSQDTGQMRTAVTAGDGFYTVPLLNPGRYQVKAALAGFRTVVREGIV